MTITAQESDATSAEKKLVDDIPKESPTIAASSEADDDNASRASASTTTKPLESTTPSFWKIIALIKGEYHILFLGIFLMVLTEAANLGIPIIVAWAWDALQLYFYELGSLSISSEAEAAATVGVSEDSIANGTMAEINKWMVIAVSVYVVSLITGFLRGVVLGILGERLVARLRKQLYESVLYQDIAFYDKHKSGEIVSRLGSDTQLLQTTISTYAPESLVGIIKMIMSLVLMFYINGKLTGISLGALVVVSVVAIPFGQKLAATSKQYQDILGEAQTRSTEALGSIRTVQSFVAEPKEMFRFMYHIGDPDKPSAKNSDGTKRDTTYTVGSKKAILQIGVVVWVFGSAFLFLYLALWYGFYLVTIEETLSLGGLSAFQSYIFIIAGALGQTAQNITNVIAGVGASGRVFYLLERKPNIKNIDGISDDDDEEMEEESEKKKPVKSSTKELRKLIVPSTPMKGDIEFDNVMFSYPTRPDVLVLNAFSLKLTKDTTTALVGSSGSGKSTVVSLIQRFYDIDDGKIYLDGTDITHLDMSWLRSQIGYVQQEPQLFGISIRENLTYGLPEEETAKITQTQLEDVCRDANAHDFISSWPEGYDTMVGERGITLSGGQKQRIAIARALLTNCRILLLDEATSALDAESEHEVQKAIENAMVGRTVVVVAHRLSTIKGANQIVVMDNRKIVGVGTHEELLTGCKRYEDLIKRQSTITGDFSGESLLKSIPPSLTIEQEC
mmetsp:Transcript_14718/g.34178  ORF Transcript_14718/g.34178 Transcript_14718/m.34178 type:complete len:732 (-) Transcript_14718:259-2454(-)|eukprot:CAMPEP_0197181528 /NCGR_PEP_ID=MMETSP1423-20130617/5786_1 /TAXON_ID=476441 /ORGANISM="Pseudo-nitzschia heimii, Strain UNC1101" /LENGTH=731 /DNA_ID=CAMNT_0042631795 /DNA_START=289 /DNA_END=2484 /DNA_ORIENTATION=+